MGKISKYAMIVFILISVTCFCTVNNSTAKTFELKFATPFSPKHTMQKKVFEPWAEKIEKMSDGRMKVTFFPGGALGKAPDIYNLTEKGIADIAYNLQDYTPGRFPLTSVFELPFMITTAEKTSRAMWKVFENSPEFREEYKKVKTLGLFCHPAGGFNTISKPVKTLEDFEGLKVRTASTYVTKALKLMGAVPVNMPITETYTALERGVVDGTVLPWEGNFVFKLADLLKYATETNFYTMTMMVVMNQKKYDSLPDDLKKIIDETTGMAMSAEAGRVYDVTNEPFKKMCLDKGMEAMQFGAEEKGKLVKLTLPLRNEWIQEMESRGLAGKKIYQSALEYSKE